MMKFSLSVLDIQGAKKEVVRGAHTSANVAVLTEQEAGSLFAPIHALGRAPRLRSMLPSVATATHHHTGDGIYDSGIDFSPGRHMLVIEAKGKAPVFQRLTFMDKNGALIATPGWGSAKPSDSNLQAWNVELPRGAQGRSPSDVARTLVTVKLVPRVEFVFVATTGFWSKGDGTEWAFYARERRRRLWAEKQMMGGYLVTIFLCEYACRRTFVKAQGQGDTWMLVHEVKTNLDRTHGVYDKMRADDINILDVYGYLNDLGARDDGQGAGSVWEVGFFGHAYPQGPIFSEYGEAMPYLQGERRDPADPNARPKDWTNPTRAEYPKLTAAHLYKAVWRIWGCNVDRPLQKAIEETQKQLEPDFDERAHVRYTYVDKREEERSYSHNEVQFNIGYLRRTLRKRHLASYARAVPDGVGAAVGCYAALLGFGSERGDNVLRVAKRSKPGRNGHFVADVSGDPVFAFYLRELGEGSSAFMDRYGFFEHRNIETMIERWRRPPFDHGRFRIRDVIQHKDGAFWELRVASGAYVRSPARRVKLETVEVRTGLVDAGKKGHLFSGPRGRVARTIAGHRPHAVLEPMDDADCAVFMQEDGKVFAMTRPRGTTEWAVDRRTIAHLSEDGSPLAAKTNGLLDHKTSIIW